MLNVWRSVYIKRDCHEHVNNLVSFPMQISFLILIFQMLGTHAYPVMQTCTQFDKRNQISDIHMHRRKANSSTILYKEISLIQFCASKLYSASLREALIGNAKIYIKCLHIDGSATYQ